MFNRDSITPQTTPEQGSAPPFQSPAQKIGHARDRVRFAMRIVEVNEGRLLDYETADQISLALMRATRDLDNLKIKMATTMI